MTTELRLALIRNFDLTPVISQVKRLYGFGDGVLEMAEKHYRYFLALHVLYPTKTIVPTELVDKVWHCHILSTKKYRRDCNDLFGYFMDHEPADPDAEPTDTLHQGFEETLDLLKTHFGVDVIKEINEMDGNLTKSADCSCSAIGKTTTSGCGGGINSCSMIAAAECGISNCAQAGANSKATECSRTRPIHSSDCRSQADCCGITTGASTLASASRCGISNCTVAEPEATAASCGITNTVRVGPTAANANCQKTELTARSERGQLHAPCGGMSDGANPSSCFSVKNSAKRASCFNVSLSAQADCQ